MTGRKRAAAKDLIPDTAGSERDHPQKRFRGENPIATPRAAKQPPATKRYGRRGRPSSPIHPVTDNIDFDELPAASAELPSKKDPKNEKPKARVPEMKGKAGRNTITEKPATGKCKPKQDRVTVQQTAIRTADNDYAPIEPTKSPHQQLSEKAKVIRPFNSVDHELNSTFFQVDTNNQARWTGNSRYQSNAPFSTSRK
jgi:hypothetical protein